jgi:hypothetical protein
MIFLRMGRSARSISRSYLCKTIVIPQQGVTMICRPSWLTNSALVYMSPHAGVGGGGGCAVIANEYSCDLLLKARAKIFSRPRFTRDIKFRVKASRPTMASISIWLCMCVADGAMGLEAGVTNRCRLSWLTNSALLYKSQCGGGGGCGVSANEYSSTQESK